MGGSIHPVILSGGAGTRLWPLSRAMYPKQLLALASDRSMLQDTVGRVTGLEFAAPTVICNEDHRFIIAEQLRDMSVEGRIVLEPAGRNTAPAVAVAALLVAEGDPDGLILVLPSDHVIADTPAFHAAVATAAKAARGGSLVTFGITPTRPETGYGYIKRGGALAGVDGCYHVDSFVEKPDRDTAQAYLDGGAHVWNSGMFLFPVKGFLDELARLEPETLERCRESVAGLHEDLDFLRLAEAPFLAIKGNSVDYAVMERTEKAAVVPADMGWNDVGAWSALWDIGQQDAAGNVLQGDVTQIDCRNAYIRSERPLVAAVGVEDMVIVATDDVVLVVPKDRAQDVKAVVDTLKAEDRSEPDLHTRVYRPWGHYEGIDADNRYQVKQIEVKPGSKLSLQMHHHRAEHWIIVQGTARVTRGEETMLLHENQSTYIPLGVTHSLENPGKIPLRLIEVQSGEYLGEDDIVRFEDRYGRAGTSR
ncbi:MAG: mannose-1-phosphate guanylyltransferase/mannose-6-phosphate isomerase [Rhodobacterales bacterium]|nr:mannose-1-phosphate guanylyltransferase/mannose-6-phosphate isomerase [Rhodobacterales bacterium]